MRKNSTRQGGAEQGSEQELARAHEELSRAQSAYQVAHLTSTRMAAVQKTQPGLVAQEEVDVAQGKDEEMNAGVSSASRDAVAGAEQEIASAKATLAEDQALFAYARISAPFDGVVTELDAYTGARFLQVLQPARMGWLYATFLKTIFCGW